MSIKTYRESIIEAMILEMKRDEKVFVIGEDISGGRGCGDFEGEAAGGPMGLTQGLWDEFGAKRVIDTPISETAIMGAAAGAAAARAQAEPLPPPRRAGLRPAEQVPRRPPAEPAAP